jgi:hypothetical protein
LEPEEICWRPYFPSIWLAKGAFPSKDFGKGIEKRMIQFHLLYSNNSSEYHWKHEYASPENTGPRPWAAHRECWTSQRCSVISENWRGTVHQMAQLPYSYELTPCDFFLFGYLKKKREGKNCRFADQVVSAVGLMVKQSS